MADEFAYDTDNDVVTLDDGTTIELEYGDRHGKPWGSLDEWRQQANPWTIAITHEGEEHLYGYWTGSLASAPTALEALGCLLSDGELSGWSTTPVGVANAYSDELGEEPTVELAVSLASQNETLHDIIGHLDSWDVESYDPEADDDE